MITFKDYVLEWWQEYLDTIPEEAAKQLMESEFIGEEETVDDYIGTAESCEAENCREWLSLQDDADQIYKLFFGYASKHEVDFTTEDFLYDMFLQNAGWYYANTNDTPSFARDFVADMATHAADYSHPQGFFEDLQHGCESGFIGMLIYNSDCKNIYIKHIDDMESYKEMIEESTGEPVANRKHIPHYTFMCWLCYEELGYGIARNLFPETF